MNTFTIYTGGNTSRPVHRHHPRRTGRLWAITTTKDGDRVVFFRANRPVTGGAA